MRDEGLLLGAMQRVHEEAVLLVADRHHRQNLRAGLGFPEPLLITFLGAVAGLRQQGATCDIAHRCSAEMMAADHFALTAGFPVLCRAYFGILGMGGSTPACCRR